jgi:hypothetical protein
MMVSVQSEKRIVHCQIRGSGSGSYTDWDGFLSLCREMAATELAG